LYEDSTQLNMVINRIVSDSKLAFQLKGGNLSCWRDWRELDLVTRLETLWQDLEGF